MCLGCIKRSEGVDERWVGKEVKERVIKWTWVGDCGSEM